MTTSIFLTGATGYIGGSLLKLLLPELSKYHIAALVRDEPRAKKLRELGVQETVIGDLDSSEVLINAASKADIAIHTANSSDHIESVRSIIAGLEKRGVTNGRKPVLFHTSGSGVLVSTQDPKGQKIDKVFTSEADIGNIDGHPKDAFHRNVDLEVLRAGQRGMIDVVIVAPPLIYGTADAPFNQHSGQIPLLIEAALNNKQVYYPGKGLNEWSNVDIHDVVDFYLILLERIVAGTAPVNENGYYFLENGNTINMKSIASKIAESLHRQAPSEFPAEAKSASEGDDERLLGWLAGYYCGHHSVFVTGKAKEMGWKAKGGHILDSVDADVAYYLAKK